MVEQTRGQWRHGGKPWWDDVAALMALTLLGGSVGAVAAVAVVLVGVLPALLAINLATVGALAGMAFWMINHAVRVSHVC